MRLRRPATPARDGARPPEERSLTDARFIGSFPRADVSLDPPLREVALLGRSNVGKSSLLNALAGRKIARVSATPGKTQALNVYQMSAMIGVGTQHAAPQHDRPYYLLDLPGYGYARASHADRTTFRRLITHSLDRPNLTGVLWLLDIRREPSPEDRAMHELFAERETRVLAALTKSDKVTRAEGERRERQLRDSLGLDDDQVIATSAREGMGIAELREAVWGLVGTAPSR